MKSEDDVKSDARRILGIPVNQNKKGIKQGIGQTESFKKLGVSCDKEDDHFEPDGWYIPRNKDKTALIFEFKDSRDPNLNKPWQNKCSASDEVKRNCTVLMHHGWKHVIGVAYNETHIKIFKNNEPISQVNNKLQRKGYYLNLFRDHPLDTIKIRNDVKTINDLLDYDFGIRNFNHRMIFTACALVAERYGARLENESNRHLQDIKSIVQTTLKNVKKKTDSNQRSKIAFLIDNYKLITPKNPDNIKYDQEFISNIYKIYQQVNSSFWNGEDVMGIFFNEFNHYNHKIENGQVFTPEHITDFMYRLLGCNYKDHILDATCGSGGFLVKAMSRMIQQIQPNDKEIKKIKTNRLFGVEINSDIFSLACANMLMHHDGKTNLLQGDARSTHIGNWIKRCNITKVLMNPPYERKSGCLHIVNNVLTNVPKGTPCAFILPDHKLERGGKIAKQIRKQNRIEKIVKLPKNLFFGIGGQPTSIFLILAGVLPYYNTENGIRYYHIFTCYMKSDGFKTVIQRGRRDVSHKWPDIENYWINAVHDCDDSRYNTGRVITNPQRCCSYKASIKRNHISKKNFFNTSLSYELYNYSIDPVKFKKNIAKYIINNWWNLGKIKDTASNNIKVPLRPIKTWRTFTLSDIFRMEYSKNGKIMGAPSGAPAPKRVLSRKGSRILPRITRSSKNNGVMGKFTLKDKKYKNKYCIFSNFISIDSLGNVFYHHGKASVGRQVYCFIPKIGKLNAFIGEFLVAVLHNAITNLNDFSLNYEVNNTTLINLKFKLPVINSGSTSQITVFYPNGIKKSLYIPDWNYMKHYMKTQLQNTSNEITGIKHYIFGINTKED